MPLHVKVSGAWKSATTPAARVSGAWKNLSNGFVRVGGAWKSFFTATPLSGYLERTTLSGGGVGNGPFTTTQNTYVFVSGGVAPYTFGWELVSGDASIGPNDGTAQSVTFSATGTAPETKVAVYRAVITDNVGTIAYSDNVTITLEFQADPLEVDLDTNTATGLDSAPGSAETNTVTATPSGGVAPYSYLWERVSGDVITMTASTSATNTWLLAGGSPATASGVYRCKVTDDDATVAYSANVNVSLELT